MRTNPEMSCQATEQSVTLQGFIADKIEQATDGHVPRVEAALYRLLQLSDEEIAEVGFTSVTTQDGTLIGYRNGTLPDDDFTSELVSQRLAAFDDVQRVGDRLTSLGLPGLETAAAYSRLRPPVVLLDVDNVEGLKLETLDITAEDITLALNASPNWKASEHALLFSKEPSHDYEGYVTKMAAILDMNKGQLCVNSKRMKLTTPLLII
jgi:hypothetical protein